MGAGWRGAAQQADGSAARASVAKKLARDRIQLELGASVRDGARALQRLKIRVTQLQRDRARLHATLARAPTHPLAQRTQHGLEAAGVAHVFAKGALVREGTE